MCFGNFASKAKRCRVVTQGKEVPHLCPQEQTAGFEPHANILPDGAEET